VTDLASEDKGKIYDGCTIYEKIYKDEETSSQPAGRDKSEKF
jgi:hypothetical protein